MTKWNKVWHFLQVWKLCSGLFNASFPYLCHLKIFNVNQSYMKLHNLCKLLIHILKYIQRVVWYNFLCYKSIIGYWHILSTFKRIEIYSKVKQLLYPIYWCSIVNCTIDMCQVVHLLMHLSVCSDTDGIWVKKWEST